jgi:hypothetical protein
MDLHKMITELEAERDRLDQAILALERLSDGKQRRRGRPPKWLKNGKLPEAEASVEEEVNGRSPDTSTR